VRSLSKCDVVLWVDEEGKDQYASDAPDACNLVSIFNTNLDGRMEFYKSQPRLCYRSYTESAWIAYKLLCRILSKINTRYTHQWRGAAKLQVGINGYN
jgi:hypothetical protein